MLANAITIEVNSLAAQLFELISMLNELINQKPKRIYRKLANEYKKLHEQSQGENILRSVILTKDFSFPSEDETGAINEMVARKTRDNLKMHLEMVGKEPKPIEEIKIEPETNNKR